MTPVLLIGRTSRFFYDKVHFQQKYYNLLILYKYLAKDWLEAYHKITYPIIIFVKQV